MVVAAVVCWCSPVRLSGNCNIVRFRGRSVRNDGHAGLWVVGPVCVAGVHVRRAAATPQRRVPDAAHVVTPCASSPPPRLALSHWTMQLPGSETRFEPCLWFQRTVTGIAATPRFMRWQRNAPSRVAVARTVAPLPSACEVLVYLAVTRTHFYAGCPLGDAVFTLGRR